MTKKEKCIDCKKMFIPDRDKVHRVDGSYGFVCGPCNHANYNRKSDRRKG